MKRFMAMMAGMEQAAKRKNWSLRTLVDDLQMLQDFANGTRTLPEEITESRGSVAAVRTAVTTSEEEVTEKIIAIGREVYKLGHDGMAEELKEVTGTQEIKETKSEEEKEIINEETETQI